MHYGSIVVKEIMHMLNKRQVIILLMKMIDVTPGCLFFSFLFFFFFFFFIYTPGCFGCSRELMNVHFYLKTPWNLEVETL